MDKEALETTASCDDCSTISRATPPTCRRRCTPFRWSTTPHGPTTRRRSTSFSRVTPWCSHSPEPCPALAATGPWICSEHRYCLPGTKEVSSTPSPTRAGTAAFGSSTVVAQARRFTCPFHAWVYDLQGKLVGVPVPSGFEGLCREEKGLVELPVAEGYGLDHRPSPTRRIPSMSRPTSGRASQTSSPSSISTGGSPTASRTCIPSRPTGR